MYVHGVDLGLIRDFTAHVVLESRVRDDEPPDPRHALGRLVHDMIHAERCRGVEYPLVVRRVGAIIREINARDERLERRPQDHLLAIDRGGVGTAVVGMFRDAGLDVAGIIPVQITNGNAPGWGDGFRSIPKRDLIAIVTRTGNEKRFHIAGGLALAKVIQGELRTFKSRYTPAGNETFAAAREREHDDLVLATAMALFVAEEEAGPRVRGAVAVSYA